MMSLAQRIVAFLVLPILLVGCTTPLHRAAFEGDTKTVISLLDQGQSFDTKGRYTPFLVPGVTVTAWEAAIIGGHEGTMRALLDRRFPVNQEGENGRTPLQFACVINPNQELIKLLLESGANPNLKGERGFTPLMSCIDGLDRGVRAQAAQLLLEHGADPNIKNNQGETALSIAAYRGNVRAAQLLLDHGAIANIVDYSGQTPAQIAENTSGNSPIVWLIRKAEGQREAGLTRMPAAPLPGISVPPVPTPAPTSDVDRLPSLRAVPKTNAYAVVIGIENYQQKLPKADFAAHDAEIMEQYLTKALGYQEQNLVVLLNERATKTSIEKYVEGWLVDRVEKGDSVFIYFSGHGAPNPKTGKAYLVPYDGDPTFVEQTGYQLDRLYERLATLPAKEVVVMLDSCFSGAGGRSVIAKGMRPMVLSVENPLLAKGRTMVLTASAGDQVSSTYDQKSHGLLTYFFLKGLQGDADQNNDKRIELRELFEYLKPQVERTARREFHNEQTPQLIGSPDTMNKGVVLIGKE